MKNIDFLYMAKPNNEDFWYYNVISSVFKCSCFKLVATSIVISRYKNVSANFLEQMYVSRDYPTF